MTAYPEELLAQRWYVVDDDEIGGWAIANVDRPTSEIDPTSTDARMLATFVHESHARYVVNQHNRAIGRFDS